MESQIEIFKSKDDQIELRVQFDADSVWLSQLQMAKLFNRNRVAITQHIGNIFKEGELDESVVCKNSLHTTKHGAITGKLQSKTTKYYNLDVIISVGYRVKSQRGTHFRQWATQRLKDYLVQGYAINEKRLAQKQQEVEYLKTGIRILNRAMAEQTTAEEFEMLRVFAQGLTLLDDYDHETLDKKGQTKTETHFPSVDDYLALIKRMYPVFESGVFARPKDQGFHSSVNQIKQGFGDYVQLLRGLSTEKGMLGHIFTKSQNKIQDPAKLSRVIGMIDQEKWSMMGADIKGKIYEGLLEKNAEDTKSGAGQYFTPRALIKTMVACIQPKPSKTIADPACGTGGFFLAAYDWIVGHNQLDRDEKEFLKNKTFHGNEIVANMRRLCLMNMYLHNIGDIVGESFISSSDALVADTGERFDYVLANPPFGKKSSYTVTNEEGEAKKEDLSYNRQDFWETTSNKQLNFLQHIKTMLKVTGQAAVVLPDNVLFEGGAGEEVRKQLMLTSDLHTILRLPTGLFYAQGVKANVLLFTNENLLFQ
ncbi:MAG: RhuM family protein [Mangrovibacterium sp.]|nr:RhuM family protein [Mangrovibacterium sp.]